LSATTLATFFRPGGSGGQEESGDAGFSETRPAPLTAVTAIESVILPVRVQSGLIETESLRTEMQVEPVRAEMHVIPTQRSLDLDDEERGRIEVVLKSVRLTGLAVWWAARAAGLVASLLASSPAWRHVDPLPVLGRDEEEEEGQWDEASAEDREKRDEEHRAAWVLEGRNSEA
jgi:hypothetical protein